MDREEVVRINRAVYSIGAYGTHGVYASDIGNLLTSYCQEHGKPVEETRIFTSFLINNRIAHSYFMEALDYYGKKYSIVYVMSKPDHNGQRSIISVY